MVVGKGKNGSTDLLDIDAVACAAEDQGSAHRLCETASLQNHVS
jgi:hypothetical protein